MTRLDRKHVYAFRNLLAIRDKGLKEAQFIRVIPVIDDLHPRNAANELCTLNDNELRAFVENDLDGALVAANELGTRIGAGTRAVVEYTLDGGLMVENSCGDNSERPQGFKSGNVEAIKDSKSLAILLAIAKSSFRVLLMLINAANITSSID